METEQTVDINTAAKLASVPRETFRRMVHNGEVEQAVQTLPNGRKRIWMSLLRQHYPGMFMSESEK